MKIAYFPKQTALQSEPVWKSFLQGMKSLGIEAVESSMDADCAVIWSVLWQGRMRGNKTVYEHYRQHNKPVFIIEVGSLDRGRTWKISANNITADGEYANDRDLDLDRFKKLQIDLQPLKTARPSSILILGQHHQSLQWTRSGTVDLWLRETVDLVRQHCDRPIVFRPHPRNPIKISGLDVTIEKPSKLEGTYDKFDIDFDHHCVISHNSGPGIQSAIAGTPVICDRSSLAYDISEKIKNIDQPCLPDRSVWFQKILHTEWTIEEIAQGIPQLRILRKISLDF